MTQRTIKVVALIVDNGNLNFYQLDGTVFTITQGDPRGPDMSNRFLEQHKLGLEVVELVVGEDDKTVTHLNNGKRNPLIRFFKALKSDVKKLFGDEKTFESSEADHEAAAAKVREVAARLFKSSTTVAESKDDLPIKMVQSEGPLGKDETIIAVTEEGIVPEIESLTDQFQAGSEGKGSTTGADNLIIRMAKMSAKRGHTAQELMTFIKGIDLPLLPDGAYLAYKRLLHLGNGVYVDPHSRKVHQRIGDLVQMDESLVDPSRRTACSTGLHVGTRHYMGGFHGRGVSNSGTMLVLIQPEDAIAVPTNERSKMRVCRYLILADLSNKAHDLVNQNKRMDDCEETMQIVAQIVAGGRPPLLGTVNIAGGYGDNLTYTINGVVQKTDISLTDARGVAQTKATAPTSPVVPVRTVDEKKNGVSLTPEKVRNNESKVKPTDAREQMKASAPAPGASARVKTAAEFYARMTDKQNTDSDRRNAAAALKAFKAKAKVSYEALALPKTAGDEAQEILDIVTKPAAQPKPSKPVPAPKQPEPAKKAPEQPSNKVIPSGNTGVPAPVKGQSRQDRARALWDVVQNSKDNKHRKEAASQLRAFKKTAKVSWSALGLGTYNVEGTLAKLLD